MPAGSKTELITVERETRVRQPGAQITSTWAAAGQLWADIKWIGGAESEQRGALRSTSRYRFTCYAEAVLELAITPADRILWNGETFNIRETPRRQMATPDIDIVGETGVTQ